MIANKLDKAEACDCEGRHAKCLSKVSKRLGLADMIFAPAASGGNSN
jgi:hypothetical protein